MVEYGLDSFGSEQGPLMGFCEHINECLSSVRDREFVDYQGGYELFNTDSVPRS